MNKNYPFTITDLSVALFPALFETTEPVKDGVFNPYSWSFIPAIAGQNKLHVTLRIHHFEKPQEFTLGKVKFEVRNGRNDKEKIVKVAKAKLCQFPIASDDNLQISIGHAELRFDQCFNISKPVIKTKRMKITLS